VFPTVASLANSEFGWRIWTTRDAFSREIRAECFWNHNRGKFAQYGHRPQSQFFLSLRGIVAKNLKRQLHVVLLYRRPCYRSLYGNADNGHYYWCPDTSSYYCDIP
jgi:hypothetical protein